MAIRVNMTDVESSDRPLVKTGWHPVKITDGEEREAGENSKNPGSVYINWEMTIQPPDDQQGLKVWMNTSLVEAALPMLKAFLDATTRYDTSGEIEFDVEDLIGADLEVMVRHKEYKGDTQAEVKRVRKLNAQSDGSDSILP